MSKLDEFIEELCPDGVEYVKMGLCLEKVANINWGNVKGESFQYIDLTSVDRDTHQISEAQTITTESAPSRAQQIVVRGDILLGSTRPMLKRFCQIPNEYDKQVCSTGFCVLRANENVLISRWLYHIISSTDFFTHVEKFQKGTSYPAITDIDVKSFIIPLPPLPVQAEIVRILDNFTELTAELTTELTTELTARKKQYEYYRDILLNNSTRKNVKRMRIGEIYDFKYGTGNTIPTVGGLYPVYGSNGVVGTHHEYNSENSPVIGHIGAYAGIVNWAAGKHFVTYNGVICKHKNQDVNCKFAYYLLLIQDFGSKSKNSSQPFVSYDVLKEPEVLIPPLSEQQRIVDILDRFDTLCNDISNGLPAEIKARQLQYEHYRDKLLTFKEKEA